MPALVGISGWADGQAGLGKKTPVRLNDDTEIEDLRRLPTDEARFAWMLKIAQGYAEALRPALRTALEQYEGVIIGTHVAPFTQAAWHEGKTSDAEHLPYFSSPTLGRMIQERVSKFPQKTVRIYCGHGHSQGYCEIGGNIKCWRVLQRW